MDFQGSRVTSDGRLILVRELDEHLGLSELIAQYLTYPRARYYWLLLAERASDAAILQRIWALPLPAG